VTTTREILESARDTLESPAQWCQGRLVDVNEGSGVRPGGPNVYSFCLTGALSRAIHGPESKHFSVWDITYPSNEHDIALNGAIRALFETLEQTYPAFVAQRAADFGLQRDDMTLGQMESALVHFNDTLSPSVIEEQLDGARGHERVVALLNDTIERITP